MAMKEEIVNYFRCDRSYEGAVSLYMKYGNRIGLKKQLNVQQQSDHLLNTLHEELRSMADIHPDVFRILVSVPVVPVKIAEPVLQEAIEDPQVMPEKSAPAEAPAPTKKVQGRKSAKK